MAAGNLSIGARVRCENCGAEGIVTKSGEGELTCCGPVVPVTSPGG